MKKSLYFLFVSILLLAANASAQTGYSFAAQKSFIPKELGKVYLGMSFKDLANEVALGKAEVGDIRFEWLELTVPVNEKNVVSMTVRIHGLSQQEKAEMLISESATDEAEDEETNRILVSRIPNHGFVYSMSIEFKPDFDLKSYVLKTYGKDGEVRKPDDEYHFYDIQWTKRTSDGLDWLIRSFHEGESRTLQLHGRITGTEWGID